MSYHLNQHKKINTFEEGQGAGAGGRHCMRQGLARVVLRNSAFLTRNPLFLSYNPLSRIRDVRGVCHGPGLWELWVSKTLGFNRGPE
jgi:hypothetical protein